MNDISNDIKKFPLISKTKVRELFTDFTDFLSWFANPLKENDGMKGTR